VSPGLSHAQVSNRGSYLEGFRYTGREAVVRSSAAWEARLSPDSPREPNGENSVAS